LIARKEGIMKRIRIPGLLDILVSADSREIETLAQDLKLDRAYQDRSLPVNRYVLRRVRKALQIDGRVFPTVAARDAEGRAAAQSALWTRLNAMVPHFEEGPDELESLAAYVRGEGLDQACGPLVQQVVGRLFSSEFKATSASWEAAIVLDKAPRTMNPVLLIWWAATKRVDRAKRLLLAMVQGDLAGVHAVGIALHNIVSGVRLMRQLFSDPSERITLSPKAIEARCLFAPGSVLRQPTASVSSVKGDLTTKTLVMLNLQAANASSGNKNIVFLRETWSRCPAEQWVPALLEGIWRRACRLPSTDGSNGDPSNCPFAPPRSSV
jgi:hypothetical protein